MIVACLPRSGEVKQAGVGDLFAVLEIQRVQVPKPADVRQSRVSNVLT